MVFKIPYFPCGFVGRSRKCSEKRLNDRFIERRLSKRHGNMGCLPVKIDRLCLLYGELPKNSENCRELRKKADGYPEMVSKQ